MSTISDMLDAMELFVAEGRKVDASDLSFDSKLAKLESLGETYGLA